MSYFYDALLIILYIVFVTKYCKKGIMATLLGITGKITSIFVAITYMPFASNILYNSFVLKMVSSFYKSRIPGEIAATTGSVSEVTQNAGLIEQASEFLANHNIDASEILNEAGGRVQESLAERMADALAAPTANIISNILGFILLFVITFFAIKLVILIVDTVFKIPGLNFLNKLLGAIFGGIFASFIIYFIILIIGLTPYMETFKMNISHTYALKYFIQLFGV